MAFQERGGETLSQINVTPLVDVMLVLLVIFMVTAPIMQQGVAVDLPAVEAGALAGDGDEPQLVVTVTEAQEVYLNDTPFSVPDLGKKLAAVLAEQPGRQVFLRADAEVSYGLVMQVMASMRQAGVKRLGMVTEPPPAG